MHDKASPYIIISMQSLHIAMAMLHHRLNDDSVAMVTPYHSVENDYVAILHS